MCLDTVTDMSETHTLPGDNSDNDIDLGYEKDVHNGFSDYDDLSMYIPIVSTLSKESPNSMITDEDDVTIFLNIPKHVVEVIFVLKALLLQSGVHHTCVGGHT